MKNCLFLFWFFAATLLAAGQSIPANPTGNSTFTIRLKDGHDLTGKVTVNPNDTTGFTMSDINGTSGSIHFTWDNIDTNHLLQTSPGLYNVCFPPSSGAQARADSKTVRIKLKDGTEHEGELAIETQGSFFTLKTKFGPMRINWNQVDISSFNYLSKTNPELYQFCMHQINANTSINPGLVKIKLRDGTELEGTVQTSPTDTRGLSIRTQFGSTYYEWGQIDLVNLSQTKPDLYQFYLQQSQIDDIKTDAQVALFVRGRFVFRSDANSLLKNYGTILTQLDTVVQSDQLAARNRSKKGSQRNQQLVNIVTSNRPVLQLFSQRCWSLRNIPRLPALRTVLLSYYNAFDALARGDFESFLSNYKYGQDLLAGPGMP